MNILHGGPVLSFSVIDTDPLIIGTYKVPLGATVNMRQEKIITKTHVGSSQGTVKEISGFGDWEVDIEFEYHGIAKAMAVLELKKLDAAWRLMKELPVTNLKLQSVGISHLVMDKLNYPHTDGSHELRASMNCVSDKQIDLSDPDNKGVMSEKSGVLDTISKVAQYL